MPTLIHTPIGRRSFLRCTVLGGVALAFGCQVTPRPRSSGGGGSFRVALFSDTHIPAIATESYRGFVPVENLRAIVPQMIAAQPEVAVLCGDAARLDGKEGDYAALRGLLEPLTSMAPVSIALGNHDHRGNFRKVFGPGPGPAGEAVDRHILVVEHGVARLVILDSLLQPNLTPGFLGKAQREWLTRYLAEATDRPVVLFVHHTLTDGDGDLLDADRLFALVRPHRQVKAIFYGHSHRWEQLNREGLHLINLPAVGYNFSDDQPVGWVEAAFSWEGVELTLRAVGGDRSRDGQKVGLRWG